MYNRNHKFNKPFYNNYNKDNRINSEDLKFKEITNEFIKNRTKKIDSGFMITMTNKKYFKNVYDYCLSQNIKPILTKLYACAGTTFSFATKINNNTYKVKSINFKFNYRYNFDVINYNYKTFTGNLQIKNVPYVLIYPINFNSGNVNIEILHFDNSVEKNKNIVSEKEKHINSNTKAIDLDIQEEIKHIDTNFIDCINIVYQDNELLDKNLNNFNFILNTFISVVKESIYFYNDSLRILHLACEKTGLIFDYTISGSLKKLISVDRKFLKQYPYKNYYITEKSDGFHSLLCKFQNDDTAYLLTDTSLIKLKNKSNANIDFECIVEGELVDDNFIVFDVLYYNGVSQITNPFSQRLKLFKTAYDHFNNSYEFNLLLKNFYQFENNEQNISKLIRVNADKKDIEGILFIEDKPYNEMTIYKWKELTTIDFVAIDATSINNVLGVDENKLKGRTVYLLGCGINKFMITRLRLERMYDFMKKYSLYPQNETNNYLVTIFDPSIYKPNCNVLICKDKDLHGKVVELYWDKNEWKLLRVRYDKNNMGNNIMTAEINWTVGCIDPISEEDLWNPEKSYFMEQTDQEKININKFHNSVKYAIFELFLKDQIHVADVGSGMGQDINKYALQHCKNLDMFEIDKSAIEEIVNRKYSKDKKMSKIEKLSKINIYNVDFTEPHALYKKIENKKKYSAVVCNFAIHYFMSTLNNNFIPLIANNVLSPYKSADIIENKLGVVIIMAMDGEKIYNLLKDKTVYSIGNDKYVIERKYDINEPFKTHGQYISVKLPFTGLLSYTEELVNFSYLNLKFKENKYSMLMSMNFNELVNSIYFKNNSFVYTSYNNLDSIDREWTSLHKFIVFQKNDPKGVIPNIMENFSLLNKGHI